MSGFVIKKGPPEFVVPAGALDDFFDPETREGCLSIPADMQPESAAVLYLLPSAFLELDAHIHWKIQARINQKEQGGMMVGEVFRDSETQQVCGIVRHLIPSEHAGDATYLQFTHEDWSRMLRTYEEQFPLREGEERLKIIGWYHTHPNMPTHMSQIDKRTHSSFWGKEWQFSVILNPQRGSWEVFNGEDCGNCRGFLCRDRQWEPSAPPDEPERDWSRDWTRSPGRNDQRDLERDDQRGAVRDPEQRERELERRERELEQRERDLERHEWELERRTMGSAPASAGSFIIKRGPESASDAPAAQRPVQHTATQRAVQHTTHSAAEERRCREWVIRRENYYLPYHDMNAPTQLLMPELLVHKICRMVRNRDVPRQASFSLTCQLEISRTPVYRSEDQVYLTFMHDCSLYAEGFEYENGLNGRLCFQKSAGGRPMGHMILTALFSEALPDYPVLCEKYGSSDVLLWYNTRNPSNFLYFDLRCSDSVVRQRASGFQIKNRPPQEPVHPLSPDLRGREIFERWFGDADIEYISTEPGLAMNLYTPRRISVQRLELFLQYLSCYTAMPGQFCAAIGYSDESDSYEDIAVPNLPNSSEIVIFLERTQRVSFCSSTLSTARSYSRFLFVLANYEVDVKWLKRSVPGYAAAFVTNLADQSYHFYHMR